ncbi:MAG: excinuclease ABC subunit UvrC [Treponema sp.]|nr:excinuclease ABC subunit UvrC [Treponema sp.]
MSENYALLKGFVKNTPLEPGVYIWRDSENRIIYVGKARALRNRLNSYFAITKNVKTAALIRNSKTIETIIVSNEYEALLLENTLIKQHSPKYNINLKDGKTYPVVRITADKFGRVFRTRRIVEDGSLYFGPFPNVQALDKTLALIEKTFTLRKCRTFKPRKSPCLYYHIGRCLAPCCGKVEEDAYNIQVERIRKLLAGETSALIIDLTGQMHEAARSLKYEEAASIRNTIHAIESLSETNSVEDMDSESRDYIAWASEGIFTTFSVISMRGGRMTGQELFSSRSAAEEHESIMTFLVAYYSPDRIPPPKVFISHGFAGPGTGSETGSDAEDDNSALNRYFQEQFGQIPEFIMPDDSERRHAAALAMAAHNAREELRRRLKERGVGPALDELKQVLSLSSRPECIEGFDISHLEGKHPVASLISFRNGNPDRKNYRHFKLKTVIGKIDDYAALREAVQRRYSRQIRENKELPDLILIDGGLGQVNAVKTVLAELGVDCDLASLAKREEEIWLPHAKTPIKLPERSEALKVLQYIRDETHRFATALNTNLRSKELCFPILESVDGIGPKRAATLMKHYGSLEKIAAAEAEEIAEKCSLKISAAKAARAAARLALEDRLAKKDRLNAKFAAKKASEEAALAAEAFAAEDKIDY